MKPEAATIQALVTALFVPSAILALGGGPNYEVTRSTTSGAGTATATGGGFELSGTLASGEAPKASADGYELTSAFVFDLAPGDCNEDGLYNLMDHVSFAACVTGPAAAMPPGCECFDVDRTGTVDLADFSRAQAAFTRAN